MVNVIVVSARRLFRFAVEQLRQVDVCREILKRYRFEKAIECFHLRFPLHCIVINMILCWFC